MGGAIDTPRSFLTALFQAAVGAGAYGDSDTLMRAKACGMCANTALEANDAHRFFAAVGSQIITGPTFTNVNNFRAILISPPASKD